MILLKKIMLRRGRFSRVSLCGWNSRWIQIEKIGMLIRETLWMSSRSLGKRRWQSTRLLRKVTFSKQYRLARHMTIQPSQSWWLMMCRSIIRMLPNKSSITQTSPSFKLPKVLQPLASTACHRAQLLGRFLTYLNNMATWMKSIKSPISKALSKIA